MKLRSHLIILVVVTFLPLLIFAGIMIVTFGNQQRHQVETSLGDTARALSLAVDRELMGWVGLLDALATSGYLDSGDFEGFYHQATRVLKSRPDWETIVLADRSGKQRLNLHLPFGPPRSRVRDLQQLRRVMETGRPAISDLFFGQVVKKQLLGVAVPVVRAGEIPYVLMSAASPAFLSRLLLQQKPSHESEATVIDRNKIIIARTRNIEQLLGKPATPLFARKSDEGQEVVWQGVTHEGLSVRATAYRSALSGWTVRVAMPVSTFEAPLRRSLSITIGGGVAFFLLGVVLAAALGRRISSSISAVSDSAAALERGETLAIAPVSIVEIAQVARALERAGARRNQIEERLKSLHEVNWAISSTLKLNEILDILLERIDSSVPYPTALTIRLCNRSTGALEPLASRNIMGEEEWKKLYVAYPNLRSNAAIETKGPRLIRNVQIDPEIQHRDWFARQGLVSCIEVPLIANEEAIGLLNLYTKDEHEFSKEEVDFLNAIASQAAIAIHNAQLYDQAEKQREALQESQALLRADIAERKRAEEELTKTTQTLQALAQASPVGIDILDPDGNVKLWNPAAERMFGWKEAEILGRPLPIIPEDKQEEFRKAYAAVLQGRPSTELETHRQRKDGSLVDVSISAGPIRDPNGNILGTMGILIDITERKRAEEQLRSSEEQLRSLASHLQSAREEERSRIAREIHDELGQALTGLKMDITWLKREIPPDKLKSMLQLIDETIQRVRKISTELRPGILDDLGLVAAIEWQAEEFQKHAGIKCAVRSRLQDRQLDRSRSTALFRIFQETLTNIARHANATKVNVDLRQGNGNVVLRIVDDGKGITASKITSPKSVGLLGMRERAVLLGGEVDIRGIKGKGTTVTARIPMQDEGDRK